MQLHVNTRKFATSFLFAHSKTSSGQFFFLLCNATPAGERFWILSSDSVTLRDRERVRTGLTYTKHGNHAIYKRRRKMQEVKSLLPPNGLVKQLFCSDWLSTCMLCKLFNKL